MEDVINDIYVVCECNGITYKEIWDAIKDGACDLEELMDKTDAGTVCGLCRSVEDDPAEERAIHLDEILQKAQLEGICPDENQD